MCENMSKLMCNKKTGPTNKSNVSPFKMVLIQVIDGDSMFSHLLANVPPRLKVDKRTPLKSGGLVLCRRIIDR